MMGDGWYLRGAGCRIRREIGSQSLGLDVALVELALISSEERRVLIDAKLRKDRASGTPALAPSINGARRRANDHESSSQISRRSTVTVAVSHPDRIFDPQSPELPHGHERVIPVLALEGWT